MDAHQDLAWNMLSYMRPFERAQADYMLTEESWKKANLKWAWCTIFTLPEFHEKQYFEKSVDAQFEIYSCLISKYSSWLVAIERKSDLISLAKSENKTGISILMEGAEPVSSPDELKSFFRRGVRAVGLAWMNRNAYASGNKSEGGLTGQGRALMDEAARLGVAVDLSHLNEESFWDAVEYRNKHLGHLSLIDSHSNAAAVCPSDRNLDDRQLAALREAEACIGIVLHNSYLKPGWIDTEFGIKKPLEPEEVFPDDVSGEEVAGKLAGGEIPEIDHPDFKPDAAQPEIVDIGIALEHIGHLKYMLGDNLVGIGSDFDGGLTRYNTPYPFEDLAGLQYLCEAVADKWGCEFAAKLAAENWFDYWLKNLPD